MKILICAGLLLASIPAGDSPSHNAQPLKVSLASPSVPATSKNAVIAIINERAPEYGIPSWFALRIAKVESNFDHRAKGDAGELGVFQMKCDTARNIGYKGACKGLLNARTNIEVGLKHLALAIEAADGNLSLAASKHNGGLARKRLVPKYVALVF